MLAVSLICTVLNEADNIAELLDSILSQTRPPDEIVINDCHSKDGTDTIIEQYISAGYPIRLVRGGHSISTGRNNAIRHAQGPIIVRIDAGLTLAPDFIERLVAPIEQGVADYTVGHAYVAPSSTFEKITGDVFYPKLPEIERLLTTGKWYTPGRNGAAYLKKHWEAIGGYAEYLDATEDRVIALHYRKLGLRYRYVSEAKVYFRPRESLRALFRQHYVYSYWTAYGRGEGQFAIRKTAEYIARIVVGLSLPVLLVLTILRAPRLLLLYSSGLIGWLVWERYRLHELFASLPPGEQLYGLNMIFLARIYREYARLYGTTVGLREWNAKRPTPWLDRQRILPALANADTSEVSLNETSSSQT